MMLDVPFLLGARVVVTGMLGSDRICGNVWVGMVGVAGRDY